MGDDNLSEDFKEILQKSNLNDKAKDAIKIISGGGTPSGKQVARPDLMNIIRFFMGTYKCTNDEDKIESIDLTSNTEEETEASVDKSCVSCIKCKQSFESLSSFQNHDCKNSKDKTNILGTDKLFKCPHCEKTFEKKRGSCRVPEKT